MSDADLADVLVGLVRNLTGPLNAVVLLVCWIASFLLFFSGCFRVIRRGDGRGQGETGTGTFLTFATSAVLFAFPQLLDAGGNSLFGYVPEQGTAVLAYGSGEEKHEELLWAVFQIVRFMGMFAFLKAWFVLRDAADGTRGATASQGFAHMVGGICGWWILPLIDAVQTTLGIAPLRIGELGGGSG